MARFAAACLVILATAAAQNAAAGETVLPPTGAVSLAAPPKESCLPDATRAGGFVTCAPAGGGGGFDLGVLLPLAGAAVVGAGLALVVAYLVLRRRAGAPLDPVDAGEWWTCANCGRNNVVGSPRCYSCGQWQR